jgi:hypothetical protein
VAKLFLFRSGEHRGKSRKLMKKERRKSIGRKGKVRATENERWNFQVMAYNCF